MRAKEILKVFLESSHQCLKSPGWANWYSKVDICKGTLPVIPSYLLIRNYFCRETTSEVFRLRSQLEDSKDHIDSLKRENKNLSLEVKDLLDQIGDGGRNLHEVERQRRRLECEKDELTSALDEAEAALEAEENRVIRLQLEITTLK